MTNTFLADLKLKNFNPQKDNIAVVIKEFTLKKRADFIQRYSEPYIVSLAIDENGCSTPAIEFNILPFPKVRKGQTIKFDGQGHLVYGPHNPGSFVAYSILYMESDKDLRNLGANVEAIVKDEATQMGLNAIVTAAPNAAVAITVLTELTALVAKRLKSNKDDELFRQGGTLLRDVQPPYDILRTYRENENDFIRPVVSILPLISSNNLGHQCKKIEL